MNRVKFMIGVILFVLACLVSIVAQPGNATTVPMQFRGPIPVVEVKLNGQGPFLFAIDTGGGLHADIDTAVVTQLKLQPTGKVRGGDPSGRNARDFDTVSVDSIVIGSVEFHNVTAISRDQRISPHYPKVDGILGFALFTDYLLTLDYPGKQLRLSRGELPVANGADILTFESPRRIPVVDVMVGDFKVKAHIDSGNQVGGFVIPAALLDQLTLASPSVTVGKARTVTNEIEIKEARLNESIKVGRFSFPQPTISFPALADEVNIGFRILRDFTLTFDQKNKRVKLEKSLPPAPASTAGGELDRKAYPGRYGERTVTFEGGALYLQREGGQKLKLVPGAKDEFSLEAIPQARIKFVRDESGQITELQVLNRAGEWEVSKRQ